jgi:hypothetical protein
MVRSHKHKIVTQILWLAVYGQTTRQTSYHPYTICQHKRDSQQVA